MAPTSNIKLAQHQTRTSNKKLIDTKASEVHDISVIAESLDLGHKNVAQIVFGLENGSDDVKKLLVNECNIIYECRVCVSMFRSFGNFVAHKRLYCKGHECERMVLYDPSWFKSKNDEKDKIVQTEKNEDNNDSIQQEKIKSNITESKTLNSDQTKQDKFPTEVSNKKRKPNSVDSNVTSFLKPQINSEMKNGIPESSFYSIETTRNTISNTSRTSNDKEKHRETLKIQSKRSTRQCLNKVISLRSKEISKSTNSNSNGSIVNNKKVKQFTQSKLSTSIDSTEVEHFQESKSNDTYEPLIIHRHFQHHHQPEPISSPSALSTKMNKICTKKSNCLKFAHKKQKSIEVIRIDD